MNILLEWQTSSEERIKQLCLKQLKDLHERFKTAAFDLSHPIHNLLSLKKNKDLLEEQKAAIPKIQVQIGPFHEKFKQIEDQNLTEEERLQKENLEADFEAFKQMLEKKEIKHNQEYKKFHKKTFQLLGDFINEAKLQKKSFLKNAPYSSVGVTDNHQAFN